ncbi:MAG: hypothetical protein P1U53_10660 [Sulfitobacter sp.]|nr:hypothetical protein [Sulfitobacter sp.]
MKSFLGILVCAILASLSPLRAAELEGASIGLHYSAFAEESDINHSALEGSLALRFSDRLLGQVDLGQDRFGLTDLEATTFGLHGIWQTAGGTDLGLFYTYEEADLAGVSGDADLWGLEIGRQIGLFEVEGYLGHGTADGGDGALWGLSSTYALGAATSLTGIYEHIDLDGLEGGKLVLRVNREVGSGTALYLEVGSARARAFGASDDEPYLGLGGQITFGPGEVPFARRGLARVLPGL